MSVVPGFEPIRFETATGTLPAVDVGDGAVLLLLHGDDADPGYWEAYVPTFAQAFRVIAPDLRDGGSVARRIEMTIALIDALETDRIGLLGHGSGGTAAIAAAAARPQAAALVVLDALDDPGNATHLAELGRRDDLHVFCVWGEDDERSPLAVGERIADALPTAALATIPGAGHDLPRSEPETLGPLLFEWLRFRYLGRSHHHEQEGPVLVTLGRRPTFAEEGLDDLLEDPAGQAGAEDPT